jgi:hypothetical protein
MNYKSAFGAVMALSVAGTMSAQAQIYGEPRFYGGPRGYPVPMEEAGVPPGEVLLIVRAAGLRPLTQPALRGSRYVLLTSDNMGGQLRVFVSAQTGRILQATPAHDPRFAYEPTRPRAVVPGPGQELRGPPPVVYGSRTPAPTSPDSAAPRPGATPDGRVANAPPAADPAPRRPARTPLPRPRPDTAANTTTTPPAAEVAPAAAAPQPAAPAQPPAVATPAAPPSNPPVAAPTELVPVAPLE